MVTKNWQECVHIDDDGLMTLRLAPSCEEVERGWVISIDWNEYLGDLSPQDVIRVSNACFRASIIVCSDSRKQHAYDTLYKALRMVGLEKDAAAQTTTFAIQQLRKDCE